MPERPRQAAAIDPFGCMRYMAPIVPADHDWTKPLISEAELDDMVAILVSQLPRTPANGDLDDESL